MSKVIPVSVQVSPAAAQITAKFFRGLGDPTRIKILEALLDGDKNVTELIKLLGSPQGRVSSHLACLRWCGYVTSYQQGKNVFYTIADPRVLDLLNLSRQILRDTAERVIACQIIR